MKKPTKAEECRAYLLNLSGFFVYLKKKKARELAAKLPSHIDYNQYLKIEVEVLDNGWVEVTFPEFSRVSGKEMPSYQRKLREKLGNRLRKLGYATNRHPFGWQVGFRFKAFDFAAEELQFEKTWKFKAK